VGEKHIDRDSCIITVGIADISTIAFKVCKGNSRIGVRVGVVLVEVERSEGLLLFLKGEKALVILPL